ncbi:MAG: transcription antitermination factor NusB [Candidatus Peribacteraceae bacterium]|nr:transcription antitermination factor NusB [Candidatus Peribacteraceae bacterium]
MPAVNRRVVREAVMQTVFECEFRGIAEGWLAVFEKNILEFEIDYEKDFAADLLEATFNNLADLKSWIEQLAPEWPFSKIAKLDAAALLVGLAELKFLAQKFNIPPKVTLNEFVEIAKSYGDDSDRKFVNGVLSSAKKELESI